MEPRTLIEPEELASYLHDPDWVIVDCRFDLDDPKLGPVAYAESHIPGAQYAHLESDLSGPTSGSNGRHPLPSLDQMVKLFSNLGIDSTCQVIGYDASGGGFAARLWWMLCYLGHERVAVLNGGFPAWLESGLPVKSGIERRAVREFDPRPDPTKLILHTQVFSDQTGLLIDSRSPERYLGQIEPIDPVSGRIPGAKNRFWKDNLDERSKMRSKEDIRAEFLEILQGTAPHATVLYCGSGVTASHNLLAMEYAGLGGAALYAGSWSEWISDPSHPVATGATER